jgi:hypothetical protein
MTTIVHDDNPWSTTRTPTTGPIEPGSCRGRNGRSPFGWTVPTRPRSTGRPGSETVSCLEAEMIPRMTGMGAKRSGLIGGDNVWVEERPSSWPGIRPPCPSQRRSNWDGPPPDRCSARR